jgi:hypothetical protein
VALLGALALAVSLLLPWYELGGAASAGTVHETGLRALGWLAVAVLVLAVAAGIGLAVTTMRAPSPALPLAVGVVAVPLALLAVLVVAVRLVAEPGLGVGAPDGDVALQPPAFVGLAGALGILVGAWVALADERTDTEEARAQTERALSVRGEPRPVPPPREPPS